MNRQEKSCGAVIFTRQNGACRYLILTSVLPDNITLCKGHVEKDETEHQTAIREIREETGLTVSFIDGFRQTSRYQPFPGIDKQVVFFLAETDGKDLTCQPEEVAAASFMPYQQAYDILSHDSDKAILKAAEDFLNAAKAD